MFQNTWKIGQTIIILVFNVSFHIDGSMFDYNRRLEMHVTKDALNRAVRESLKDEIAQFSHGCLHTNI